MDGLEQRANAPVTGLRRLATAAIALLAWTGLEVQLEASIGLTGGVGSALWSMALYFTVLTNLLVALLFSALALGLAVRPFVRGGVTIAILLVGVVYHLLLRGMVELSGGALLADWINHSITPLLVTLYWLLLDPKGGLKRRDPWWWALYPLAYFAYGLTRGATEGRYPYPFMNLAKLGWGPVLAYAVAMALGFLVAGMAMVALDRRLGRR